MGLRKVGREFPSYRPRLRVRHDEHVLDAHRKTSIALCSRFPHEYFEHLEADASDVTDTRLRGGDLEGPEDRLVLSVLDLDGVEMRVIGHGGDVEVVEGQVSVYLL